MKAAPKSKSRVLIRPPTLGDCVAFLEGVRRSRALHRTWINPKADTSEAFDTYMKRFASGVHHGFLVIERESDRIAGVINLNDIVRGGFQSASLGYYAFAPLAGKGLMREGLLLVLDYAFRKLKLHRLEANIQPKNRASIALVKKCGFTYEGFSPRYVKVCGRWKDHERWAMLAENYLKQNAKRRK